MEKFWRKAVRSILALGVTGVLMFASGCGDDDDDDNRDITPDAFSFAPQTGVQLSTPSTSETVTITGIDGPAPITISGGGSYSINGGTFISTPATVNNNQTVAVRNPSPATNSTVTTSILTIGGASADFTTITLPAAGADVTPDTFNFPARTDVQLSTLSSSDPITVTGITAPAPITVTGGTYSINGGTFTSTAGTVNANQTVAVQHTSSAANSTATTTTLTIGDVNGVGGVSADFTSTTLAAPVGADTTPNPFSFTALTNVPLSTLSTSEEITVTGIDAAVPISVTNGTYSIGNGPFISTPATVTNNQTVRVQHTSSAANNAATTTTLTIGGVSADFTTTTLAAGTTVDAAALYQTRCASCHSLGTVDTTATIGPELSGSTDVPTRFTGPHFGITLTASEISAMDAYVRAN